MLARLEVSSEVPGRTIQEAESPGKMRNDSCEAFHQVLNEHEERSENDIIFVYYIHLHYIHTYYIYTKNMFINFAGSILKTSAATSEGGLVNFTRGRRPGIHEQALRWATDVPAFATRLFFCPVGGSQWQSQGKLV